MGEIREKQIMQVIKTYMIARNYPPTVREIADMVGLSLSNTHHYLEIMRTKDLINYRDGESRTITVTGINYRTDYEEGVADDRVED